MRTTLAAAVCLLASTACADWQGTTWGMSLEEADALLAVPHRRATAKELQSNGWSDDRGKIIIDQYWVGDLMFRGWLLFDHDALSAIILAVDAPSLPSCRKLWSSLEQTYGPPESHIDDGEMLWAVWLSAKYKNRVALAHSELASCHIEYKPVPFPAL